MPAKDSLTVDIRTDIGMLGRSIPDSYKRILPLYRTQAVCDITNIILGIIATKILGFLVLDCDICPYRNKISDFFEHFLRYGKYRNLGPKSLKFVLL